MFDPSMMAAAQRMMSKMSPEQIAAMQQQAASMDPSQMQQAMNMFSNMTPEQKRSMQDMMGSVPPETLVQQAGAAQGQLSAQQKYQYDGSMQLKNEGNRLHGLKQFKEAAEKYQRAIDNLATHTSAQSATLRTSCQSNLASCYLQLEQWDDCVTQCDAVLRADPANRKAFYRKGQAEAALGRFDDAVRDLARALEMSPDSEKGVIREKLEDAREKQALATRGVIIEEVEEDAGEAEGVSADDVEDDGQETSAADGEESENVAAVAAPAPAPVPSPPLVPAPGPAQSPQVAMAADMVKQNPDMVRQAAEAMAKMSDAELAAHLASAGGAGLPPGATPEMARAAAEMMKNMSPDQVKEMADKAASMAAMTGGGPGVPPPAVADPAAAAEAFKRDPNALKMASKMMESMSPEELEAMMAAVPGAPPGMKLDPAQVKMAAKMMESMSPEEFEKMTAMAQSMGGMSGMPGFPSAGAAPGVPAVTAGAAGAGGAAAHVPGAAPHFDPGNMSAGMLDEMRKKMSDPAMLRSMQSMLKGMDPATLASMMQSSGMNMTPEQAEKMVNQMNNVSDRQLEWIARIMAVVNFIVATYQRARAWAMSNGALVVAIVLLLVALFLRWRGWL